MTRLRRHRGEADTEIQHNRNLGARRGWMIGIMFRPLHPQERRGTYRTECGPRARSGLAQRNLARTGIRSPDRPSRSESLYILSHPVRKTIFK